MSSNTVATITTTTDATAATAASITANTTTAVGVVSDNTTAAKSQPSLSRQNKLRDAHGRFVSSSHAATAT
jgi:hypothetical protein